MNDIRIVEADLDRPEHQRAVLELTDAYSRDPMGDGHPLSPEVREALIPGLQRHPTTLIFLAYDGTDAVGIATCFLGFSTFSARPLINIHDLGVLPAQRGRGIGRQLLAAIESKARALGCCKLTLETQENNSAPAASTPPPASPRARTRPRQAERCSWRRSFEPGGELNPNRTSLTLTLCLRPGRGQTIAQAADSGRETADRANCLPSPRPRGEGKGEGSAVGSALSPRRAGRSETATDSPG